MHANRKGAIPPAGRVFDMDKDANAC